MLKKLIMAVLCSGLLIVSLTACAQEKDLASLPRDEVKNEINILSATYPLNLNPHTCTDEDASTIFKSLYEGLTALDENGKPTLLQAKEVSLSDDKLEATIRIRDGIKYSDGKEITSGDYVSAWQKALEPGTASPYAFMFDNIENAYEIRKGEKAPHELGAHTPDDKTIQLKFVSPTDNLTDMLSFRVFYPVRMGENESYIGNGAFKVTGYDAGRALVLEPNGNYYQKDSIKLEKITFALKPKTIDSIKTFREDDLSFTSKPEPSELSAMKSRPEYGNIKTISTTYLSFQTTKSPFDSSEIRQALSLSLDRNNLVTVLPEDNLVAASTYIPEGVRDTDPNTEFAKTKQGYYPLNDSGRGTALTNLTAKGYANAKGFPTIELVYDKTRHEQVARQIQKAWHKNLDVTAKITGLSKDDFDSALKTGDYDVAINSSCAAYNDPLPMLERFTSNNTRNIERYISSDYDTKIDNAKHADTTEERFLLLHEAQDILMLDMPCAPLYYGDVPYLKDPNLSDVLISPMGYFDFSFALLENKN